MEVVMCLENPSLIRFCAFVPLPTTTDIHVIAVLCIFMDMHIVYLVMTYPSLVPRPRPKEGGGVWHLVMLFLVLDLNIEISNQTAD